MTINEIRNIISEGMQMFSFKYNGKWGDVDPCYIPESKSQEYLLFFDDKEQIVYDLDAVMNTRFIDGKSLTEIADKITDIDL